MGCRRIFRHVGKDNQAMAELRKRIGLQLSAISYLLEGQIHENHQKFLEAAEMVRKTGQRMVVLVGSPIHPFGNYEETARRRSMSRKGSLPGPVAPERSAIVVFLYRSVRLSLVVRRVWNARVRKRWLAVRLC